MSITRIPHKGPSAGDKVIGLLVAGLAVLLLFLLGIWAVNAQEVAAPGGVAVDLRPSALALIEMLGAAALAIANVAGVIFTRWMAAKTGLERSRLEAEYNARIGDIIHRGIEYAITTMKNEAAKPDSPITKVEFNNQFLGLVATYVNTGAKGLLDEMRVSEGRLLELIVARLPAYFADVPVQGGASATPTAASVGRQMDIPVAPPVSGQTAPPVVGTDVATNAG